MSTASSNQYVVVALLNHASTTHRLSILNRLASSPFEIVAERSLHLVPPDDDALLRAFLANEIDAQGEAETLIKWALKFTTATNSFIALKPTRPIDNAASFFLNDHAVQLREQYGEDEVYVSPDRATAQMQVELLFPELAQPNAPRMAHDASSSGESHASVSTTGTSVRPQSRLSNVATGFKARAIPSTVRSKPSIEPRLSKAAALRMGISFDSPQRRVVVPPVKAADDASVGISGVARTSVKQPDSLKAPTIAPRLNKAAVARQGGEAARPASSAGVVARERKQVDFSNTPGHKRAPLSGCSSVASTAPPCIVPRQNRASMSRIQGSSSVISPTTSSTRPPSAFRKPVDYSNTPGHKRASIGGSTIASIAPPSIAPRQNRASMSRIQGSASPTKPPPSAFPAKKNIDFANTPGHKRASLSLSIASLAAPVVAPRQNRASLARTRPTTAEVKEVEDKENTAAPARTDSAIAKRTQAFANTPGHKRNSLSFALASLKQPSIQPRLNKAAGARIAAKPSSK